MRAHHWVRHEVAVAPAPMECPGGRLQLCGPTAASVPAPACRTVRPVVPLHMVRLRSPHERRSKGSPLLHELPPAAGAHRSPGSSAPSPSDPSAGWRRGGRRPRTGPARCVARRNRASRIGRRAPGPSGGNLETLQLTVQVVLTWPPCNLHCASAAMVRWCWARRVRMLRCACNSGCHTVSQL